MKTFLTTAITLIALSAPAFASGDGDAEKGEKVFKKCKACHAIVTPEGEAIVKGGKTGPDLWGVIGRTAGSVEDFKYGDSIVAAGQAGLVWDEESLAKYVEDPKAFLVEATGDSAAKTKMTFKLNKDQADVAAYLATFAKPAE